MNDISRYYQRITPILTKNYVDPDKGNTTYHIMCQYIFILSHKVKNLNNKELRGSIIADGQTTENHVMNVAKMIATKNAPDTWSPTESKVIRGQLVTVHDWRHLSRIIVIKMTGSKVHMIFTKGDMHPAMTDRKCRWANGRILLWCCTGEMQLVHSYITSKTATKDSEMCNTAWSKQKWAMNW